MVANINDIPDIQGSPDNRRIAIDQVGIKDIRYPITVRDRAGEALPTVAHATMTVQLPEQYKGTHMSRFIEILHKHKDPISADTFGALLDSMLARLEAEAGRIVLAFPFFARKAAPVTGTESLLDYEVTLTGERDLEGNRSFYIGVQIPVTSLCPCSKEISDYGAHNQRAHVTVNARVDGPIWIQDIIDLVEEAASCQLYAILKRPDEKYVTERAYDNPKFVEDMIRDMAGALDREDRIRAYTLEAENFEAIHNHQAYAVINRVKDAGTA
ncbi:MAG: GTP cyclohydrolase FolE2 [Halofilum sp. (in: g-proteobacteria)]|nr:GTP cyclohydrolase FolE2 [Halofilum sp. (in: g-proteobacteria)]